MGSRRDVLQNFIRYAPYVQEKVSSGIEQNRKGWAEMHLKDEFGHPVRDAKITVIQKKHEFKYGANLFMLDELETDQKNEQYKRSFKEAFNMATLPFYWSDLEPQKGNLRYDRNSQKVYRRPATDLCMEFCEENGIEPREHGLAYEHFFPEWLKHADVKEVKMNFERRCREISERYADRIPTIEVTNEMFWGKGTTSFYEAPDYIEWCFKTAEKYFPYNKLVINEWSGIWHSIDTASAYYHMIENAILKGAKIDAVGMQYHMFFNAENELSETQSYYNPKQLFKILDTFAHFHLPIQITEVTIPAYSCKTEDEQMQADILENLYPIWFSHPNVEQIIYWNLVDGYAYGAAQGDMACGENYFYGGLLRFDMTPKPAYYVIKNFFDKVWHTEESVVSDAGGLAMFKGFYGEYDVTVESGGRISNCKINLRKGAQNSFEVCI